MSKQHETDPRAPETAQEQASNPSPAPASPEKDETSARNNGKKPTQPGQDENLAGLRRAYADLAHKKTGS